ncbi:MAG: uL15 family ribosomal protein [DPANN group archaeon]|nr:uL15 family ribosomal protein [DPANN group archaeon]
MKKRKKNTRQRGSHTHGWGSKKKHRGAGNRGGRGKAGSGKRGDAKKPSFWKNKNYSGKSKGFKSLKKPLKTINIEELKQFKETKINLTKEGYDKLLGKGTPSREYDLIVSQASESAIKKIQKAGGTVSGLKEKREKPVEGVREVTKEKIEKPQEPQEEVKKIETVESAEE